MSVFVAKYGGESLGPVELLQHDETRQLMNAANIVSEAVKAGDMPVVVTSAFFKRTNALVQEFRAVTGLGDMPIEQVTDIAVRREYDALVSTGEAQSSACLSLAIQRHGVPAESLRCWQAPVITDSNHGAAQIQRIETGRLVRNVNMDTVSVVCGFQGVTDHEEGCEHGCITTTGRNTSDLVAVLVAAEMGKALGEPVECRIYKGVWGVFTADPRDKQNGSDVELLEHVSYEDMVGLSKVSEEANRSAVIHSSASEAAMRLNVPLRVLSFERSSRSVFAGTTIGEGVTRSADIGVSAHAFAAAASAASPSSGKLPGPPIDVDRAVAAVEEKPEEPALAAG